VDESGSSLWVASVLAFGSGGRGQVQKRRTLPAREWVGVGGWMQPAKGRETYPMQPGVVTSG